MGIRREAVEVSYSSNIASGASRDAAAVSNLDRALTGLSGHRFFQSPPGGGQLQTYQRQADGASTSINQLTGRLSLLGDTLLGLAPASVTVGAVGVQALGGLAAAATAVALAGGAAAIGLQGIGDAVSAVDDYQLDPTVANLKKAQAALESLDPAAARFVARFQETQPILTELRDAAARGLFDGGLTAALDDFEAAAPRLEALLTAGGRAGGIVAEDVAGALASDRWEEFLTFLTDETPAAMASLSRTTGNLTHGISEMFMALDPGNDAFLGWLEDVTAQFDRYASSAEGAEDITAILDYARETGPDLAELFSSAASGLAALTRAAAPLSGPVLDSLTAITDLIGVVADSDLGTPIMAGVLALRLYDRAARLAERTQARLTGSAAAAAAQAARMTAAQQAGALVGVPAHLRGALVAPHPSQVRAERRAAAFRAGGAAAGLGFAMSGAAEEVGLMNTAVLGMAGPIGAAVGLLLDFAQHTNQMEDAQASLNAVMADSSSTFADYVAAEQALSDARKSYLDDYGSVENLMSSLADNPVETMKESWRLGLDSLDGTNDRLNEAGALTKGLSTETASLARSYLLLAQQLGDTSINPGDFLNIDPKQIEELRNRLRGPLSEMGVTEPELTAMNPAQVQNLAREFGNLNGQILESNNLLRGFTDSLARAQGFLTKRDAMRSYQDAIDAATASLKDNGKTLDENTPKGRANAAALDEIAASGLRIADGMKDGGERQRRFLRGLRAQLAQTAGAFGMTRPEIAAFLDGLNLVDRRAQRLRQALNTLPKDVRTRILTDGVPKTKAEIRDLVSEYKLTEKERRALIRLMNAEQTKAAARALAAVLDQAARDRQATITITTNRRINEIRTLALETPGRVGGRAAGGSIPKDGGPYADRYLYMLAPGEEVISNRFGQADRHRALLKAINAGGYADGGTTGALTGSGMARRTAEARAGAAAGGGVHRHLHHHDMQAGKLTGTLKTPWGPAEVELIASEVARREIDADRQFERTHG